MSNDEHLLIARGHELTEEGNFEAALDAFNQALALAPHSGYAWYSKGCLLSEWQRYEDAILCYAEAANAEPDKAALAFFNMGNAFQELGQLDKAVECFQFCVEQNPEFADAWINLGRIFDDVGRHKEAISCYDQALPQAPDDEVAWANRGNSLRQLGRHEEAIDSYAKALELNPTNLAALCGTGECLHGLDKHADALPYIESCLEHYPGCTPAWCLKAVLLSLLGNDEQALLTIDSALKLEKTPELWNNKAEILRKLDRFDEALACFDNALRLDSDYVPAHFGKARVFINLDRFSDAQELLHRYLELADPDHDLMETAKVALQLCQERQRER